MTSTEMFGKAKWVGAPEDCSAPLLRTEIEIPSVKNAVITICGLGFFELYLNDKKVSEDLLVPAFSQYNFRDLSAHYERPDKLSFRVWCMQYDVTDYLTGGANALSVRLGNGWFRLAGVGTENASRANYGRLKLCYKLTVETDEGKTVEYFSDENMKWSASELTANNLYTGERYDYSLEKAGFSAVGYDDSAWEKVDIVDAPDSNFYIQNAPTDKIIRTVKPTLLGVRDDGIRVYDTGEAIVGYALVKAGKEEINIRYADEIKDGLELDFAPSGGSRIQEEIFKNAAEGRLCFPRFCWHGFRYFEVKGDAEVVEVRVIHSDCDITSSFDSDNEVLNWLYKTYCRTQLDNMHCSTPSDCPHIERLGYTGDGQLCCETVMTLFDTREFYRKWMCDIADCQDVETGHVQHTAPFCGGGGGPSGWGGAIVMVPWMFYRCFGEKDVLKQYFPNMLKYFDYLVSRSEGGLVVREEKEWCLGDWNAPIEVFYPEHKIETKTLIPEAFVNTALFIKFMRIVLKIADLIGETEKVAHLPELIEKCTRAVNNAYFSPFTRSYCGDLQGANSIAIDAGLGEERTFNETVAKYKGLGRFDTGIIATDYLPKILFDRGEGQLAFDLITSKELVSYHYMMTHGATTLWEDWHPSRSLNHPMFGSLTRYLQMYFLGIRQPEDSAGYEKVLIAPCLVNGMDRASGHITTVKGKIAVSYQKSDGKVEFNVTIPDGVEATFDLNGKSQPLTAGEQTLTFEI